MGMHPATKQRDYFLRLGGFKSANDGFLGSRGAMLFEPYTDRPDYRVHYQQYNSDSDTYGSLVGNPEVFYSHCKDAVTHGFCVDSHAIGDRGVSEVIDVLERIHADMDQDMSMFRIIHAEIVQPREFDRIKALNLIVETNPSQIADDMRWLEIPTAYVFHFLNAWTEGDTVRVFGTPAPWLGLDFENDAPPQGLDVNTYMHEWTVDLATDSVALRRTSELPGEYGKVADAVAGVPHRYGYMSSFSTGECDGGYFDGFTQLDLEQDTETTWSEPGKVFGEVAFAPDVEDASGDERAGWIVGYVHAADGSSSEFLVTDARDVSAGPIARIPLPRRVPFGFHGNWMTPED